MNFEYTFPSNHMDDHDSLIISQEYNMKVSCYLDSDVSNAFIVTVKITDLFEGNLRDTVVEISIGAPL